jgi:hypothetical protein
MFAELTIVVDGAVEETPTFLDECAMRDYIGAIEDEAKSDGYPTEVYVTYHNHDLYLDDGCECAQYVTDGRPAYSFNVEPHERTAKDDVVDAIDAIRRALLREK